MPLSRYYTVYSFVYKKVLKEVRTMQISKPPTHFTIWNTRISFLGGSQFSDEQFVYVCEYYSCSPQLTFSKPNEYKYELEILFVAQIASHFIREITLNKHVPNSLNDRSVY